MKLKKLILKDFRQFYDEQELLLDVLDDKNVVIIHGENGSGKTTILQAFMWCLYGGELNLEHPTRLLNEYSFSKLPENKTKEVSVILILNDRHKEYKIIRKAIILKKEGSQSILDKNLVVFIDGTSSERPQDTVNHILHKKLKEYFFFDGERIDKLAQPEFSGEVKEGIKSIMGIEILNNARNRIKDARKDLTTEFDNMNDSKTESPHEKLNKEELKFDQIGEELENNKQYKVQKLEDKKNLEKQLLEVREIEYLVNTLKDLEGRQNIVEKEINQIYNKEKRYFTKFSYFAISNNLLVKVKNLLESIREKGELPSGIREQFIEDLLDRGTCICGREIQNGDENYQNLKKVLRAAIFREIVDAARFFFFKNNKYALKCPCSTASKLISNFFRNSKKLVKSFL